MQSPKRVEFAFLASLVLFAASFLPSNAESQQRWFTLPQTPTLPLQTSSGFVDRKDALIWYATFGDDANPPVLLLHGGGGSSDYWGHLIRDLTRDYRVVVFDCRGQGRSTNEAPAISYELMARDALAVLDQLGIRRASFAGWSDGANIGFVFALKYPDRISALVAFAGNATPSGYQPNRTPAAMAAYVARTRSEYELLSPHPKRYGEIQRLLSYMWQTEPQLTAQDLGAIRAQTTILHAEHDEIIRRSHSMEIASHVPNARFVMLHGVGHFALLQDPEGFNKQVRNALAAK